MKKYVALLTVLVLLPVMASAITVKEFEEAYNAAIGRGNTVDRNYYGSMSSSGALFLQDIYGGSYVAVMTEPESAEQMEDRSLKHVLVTRAADGSMGEYLAACLAAAKALYPDMDSAERDATIIQAIAWSHMLMGDPPFYPIAYKLNEAIGEIVYNETSEKCQLLIPAPVQP